MLYFLKLIIIYVFVSIITLEAKRPVQKFFANYEYKIPENVHADLIPMVEKINNHVNFSFTKFGDGELGCMYGEQAANCDGDKYHDWLKNKLIDSLLYLCSRKDVYLGTWGSQFYEKSPHTIFFEELITNHFGSLSVPCTWCFYRTLINDDYFDQTSDLYNFVKSIKNTNRKKIIMCNPNNSRLKEFFNAQHIIQLPYNNWSYEYVHYKNLLLNLIEENAIILIAGGLCSKVLMADILRNHNVTFLDIGSGFDFLGSKKNSRGHWHSLQEELNYYHDLIPKEWLR